MGISRILFCLWSAIFSIKMLLFPLWDISLRLVFYIGYSTVSYNSTSLSANEAFRFKAKTKSGCIKGRLNAEISGGRQQSKISIEHIPDKDQVREG